MTVPVEFEDRLRRGLESAAVSLPGACGPAVARAPQLVVGAAATSWPRRRVTYSVLAGATAILAAIVLSSNGPEASVQDTSVEDTSDVAAAERSGRPITDAVPFDDYAGSYVDDQLSARYRSCAVAAGFDPEFVQVLVTSSGVPWWAKTGREVPASVHGPCLIAIGGQDPHTSSYGN